MGEFMQIKRYVMEFANDEIRRDMENKLMKPAIRKARRAKIENIVRAYKRFSITAAEAVRAILEVGASDNDW